MFTDQPGERRWRGSHSEQAVERTLKQGALQGSELKRAVIRLVRQVTGKTPEEPPVGWKEHQAGEGFWKAGEEGGGGRRWRAKESAVSR